MGVEEARKWLDENEAIQTDLQGTFISVDALPQLLARHARPYIEQRDAARERAACLYRILAEGFRVDMNKPAQYEKGWNDSTRAMHKAVTEELGEMEDSYEELLADSVKLEAAEAELAKTREQLKTARYLGDNHHNAADCPYCDPKAGEQPGGKK